MAASEGSAGAGEIRVALLLPLSGPDANLGRALLDAATLALFDQSATEAAATETKLTLLPRDTGTTPDSAAQAAQAALNDGARLLLGPLTAAATAAVRPIAGEGGVKIISFSNDRAVAGGGVYVLGFTPEQEISRVIEFARAKGLSRFAALAPENAFGKTAIEAVERNVRNVGGRMASVVRYAPDAKSADLSAAVLRLLGQGPAPKSPPAIAGKAAAGQVILDFDALFLAEGGANLRALAPWLAQHDINTGQVRLLGSGQWDEAGLGREPALVGGWFAQAPPEAQAAFRARFKSSFGREPPRRASLAYDAVAVAKELLRVGAGRVDAALIEDPKGYAGYDGIFRFRADGTAERGLAIAQVEPRGLTVIDPAPTTFQRPAY